jgi:hypothetical protein
MLYLFQKLSSIILKRGDLVKFAKLLSLFVLSIVLSSCSILGEEENLAPVISGEDYIAYALGDTVPDWGSLYTFTDEEDGIVIFNDSMVDDSKVDYETEGEYIVKIYATDSDGKVSLLEVTLEVIDNREHLISLVGDESVDIEVNGSFNDPGAIVEVSDGSTKDYEVTSDVDFNKVGTYTVTYTIENRNEFVIRTLNVVDLTHPTITINGRETEYIGINQTFTDPGIVYSDNYDSEDDLVVTVENSVDNSTPGTYTVTYTVTDLSGNSTSVVRDVNVVDGSLPMIVLDGEAVIEVEINSTYIENEATFIDENGYVEVSTLDTVDLSVLGDYVLNYSYTDENNDSYSVTRLVKVIDISKPTITYLGENIVIDIKDQIPELEFEISDNSLEELIVAIDDSNVDYDVAGEYLIYASVEDSSGNMSTSIEISVQVMKHMPTISVNSVTTTSDKINIDYEISDVDEALRSQVLNIYRNEVLFKTIDLVVGSQTLEISDLYSASEYSLSIDFEFDLSNDNIISYENVYSEGVETKAVAIPLLNNDINVQDTYICSDISIEDTDSSLISFKVELLQGTDTMESLEMVEGQTKYCFVSLSPQTDYSIKLEYTYNLRDGDGDQVDTNTESVTTLITAPTFTSFSILNEGDIFIGEKLQFSLEVDNPSNLYIYSIKVNGSVITTFDKGDNISTLSFTMDNKTNAGLVKYSIEEISLYNNGVVTTYLLQSNNSIDVNIYRELTVKNISIIGSELVEQNTSIQAFIEFEDVYDYTIESITFNNVLYSSSEFSIEDNVISLSFDVGSGFDLVKSYYVSNITYKSNEVSITHDTNSKSLYLYVYTSTLNPIYINTVEDLQNMGNRGYYILNSDLDLSSVSNWKGLDFYGYFDGNNHIIDNLTIAVYHTGGFEYIGLFANNGGIIKNITISNVDIDLNSITNLNYGGVNGGSLVGENQGLVENITILSGSIDISLIEGLELSIGGIIGKSATTATYKNLINHINISLTASESLNFNGKIGGIIGDSYYGLDIEDSYNTGSITGSIYFSTVAGGIIGSISTSKNITNIINTYNSGDIEAKNISAGLIAVYSGLKLNIENSFNTGVISSSYEYGSTSGLIGQVSSGHGFDNPHTTSLSLINTYNSGTISGGSNAFGLLGWNESFNIYIENSYNSGNIIGSSDVAGIANSMNGNFILKNVFSTGNISIINYPSGFMLRFGNILSSAPEYSSIIFENIYYSGYFTHPSSPIFVYIIGEEVTDLSTFDETFFTNTLTWDNTIWDFKNIDIPNEVYPILIYDTEE